MYEALLPRAGGAGGHKEGGKRAPWLAGVKLAGGTQGQTLGRHVGRPPRATAVRAAPASARLFNQRPARAPSRAPFRGGGACPGPAPSPAPPPRGPRPSAGPVAGGRDLHREVRAEKFGAPCAQGPPPGEAALPAVPERLGSLGLVCYWRWWY